MNHDKVSKTSINLAEERLQQLAELFPEAFREGRIDFDQFRALLDENILDSKSERFSFTWAGKKDAVRLAQMPSRATLVPAPEESVNWETTGNVFIEGDNLEVLKLIGRSYFGRVKMIYIDPPYNTGNDFVYPDNYSDPLDTYLHMTGQVDGNGNRLTSNTETSGRFHSAWLSMMYPRLMLSRQLLRDDGAIFVSIDDNEVHHLLTLMDELFGEENFVANFPWKKRTAKSDVPFGVSQDFEWIVCYARSGKFLAGSKHERKYYQTDDFPNDRWRLSDLTTQRTPEERPNSNFDLIDPKTGKKYPVNPKRVWGVTKETFQDYYDRGKIVFPDDYPFLNITVPAYRVFESEDKAKALKRYGTEDALKALSTQFPNTVGMTESGSKEIEELFGEKIFPFPKPSSLIQYLIATATNGDDIVLDFFAGSGTTAHAIMAQNAEDGGNRRFLLVQLPEKTKPDSLAYQRGYLNIADIAKDRIRRVIQRMIEAESGKLDGFEQIPSDLGFRVFKLAESNYRQWQSTEDTGEILQQLELMAQSLLVEGWKPEDVIFEVAIKEGYGLNIEITLVDGVNGNTIYRVTDPDKAQTFYICLDEQLPDDLLIRLGLTRDDLFICLDSALNDTLAANFALQARLKTL
jgi:adenine-specific DNA-methyltransferase